MREIYLAGGALGVGVALRKRGYRSDSDVNSVVVSGVEISEM